MADSALQRSLRRIRRLDGKNARDANGSTRRRGCKDRRACGALASRRRNRLMAVDARTDFLSVTFPKGSGAVQPRRRRDAQGGHARSGPLATRLRLTRVSSARRPTGVTGRERPGAAPVAIPVGRGHAPCSQARAPPRRGGPRGRSRFAVGGRRPTRPAPGRPKTATRRHRGRADRRQGVPARRGRRSGQTETTSPSTTTACRPGSGPRPESPGAAGKRLHDGPHSPCESAG
jgi:hypothetical protein